MRITFMKKGKSEKRSILLATLGTEAQVITIVLDRLLAMGEPIRRVVVIYTENSRVQEALQIVDNEIKSYYQDIEFEARPVIKGDAVLEDFRCDEDLKCLTRTMYNEVRAARGRGESIHLSISGGRKVMSVMAMVVAQLLFGPNDQVWHLITEGWQPGSSRKLHLLPDQEAWMVPVPVLRWSEANFMIRMLAEVDDPESIIEWQMKVEKAAQMKRRHEFIEHWLTRVERETVELVCQGLNNTSIADMRNIKEQTVANQLGVIYDKYKEWASLWDEENVRTRLIAEFAPYYALRRMENDIARDRC